MKITYFLSNRKEKDWQQLTRQIRMFLVRKKIDLNSKILIEISDSMKSETKFNTVKITITWKNKISFQYPPPFLPSLAWCR